MKKIVLSFVFGALVLLSACTTGLNSLPVLFDSNEDIISFQALAAAALLPSGDEQPLSSQNQNQLLSYVLLETEETTQEPTEELPEDDPLLDTIQPYIELVEQFLSTDNGLTVQVGMSDIEGYALMMTFETRGMLGEVQRYVIHYNMTLTDEDDDESEFELEGIMIVNGQQYTLFGEREVEDDEEKIEFIAKLDDLNYLESEYKIETDEIEFEIKVVMNGEVVTETKIEIEYEEDETKIELDFVDGESKGTYEFKFEMEGEQPILKIEFDVVIDGVREFGEIVVSIHVDETTGETYYRIFVDADDDDVRHERNIRRKIKHDDAEDSDPSEPEESDPSDPEESEPTDDTLS